MLQKPEDPKLELIESIAQQIRDKLPAEEAATAEAFARQYFLQTDSEDLKERTPADLYGAVVSHWHFARSFPPGEPKIRVYNPRLPEHGWQSTHTVVEIVNDDMPFLVNSITMEVNRQGLTLHLIIHPVMKIRRDESHRLIAVATDRHEGEGRFESLMHVEVDRRTDPAQLEALHDGLMRILNNVRAAVEDWRKMQHRLLESLADIEQNPPPQPPADTAEDRAFLQWAATDNFTFLGYRDYDLVTEDGQDVLRVVPGTGLGIMRETGQEQRSASFAALPAELRSQARESKLLLLTKANARATVHRPGYLDYIGIKRFDADGSVLGERRFLGMYTHAAYNSSPTQIPVLRRKVAAALQRAGFLPKSHDAKALTTILEQYPRDELLQISSEELYENAIGIVRLGERQRTRLFVRRDVFGRSYSCLIYVPREHYNTELRQRMQEILLETFQGESAEYNVQVADHPLARILIIIHTKPGSSVAFDVREVEARLVRATRRWRDDLHQALIEHGGEERANRLLARYAGGFPAGYRETYAARIAVHDIELMEQLGSPDSLAMNLYVPLEAAPGSLRFKIFRAGEAVTLSRSLPMLEHMGVRVMEERSYQFRRADGSAVSGHDFGMLVPGREEVDVESVRADFQEAFLRTWRGDLENDDFNKLVLLAGLDWREVSVLRAYAKYMKQAGFTFSTSYIQQCLAAHPDLAARLVALFRARFEPGTQAPREQAVKQLTAQIEEGLDEVANLDEDRILRQFLAVILATVRTSFYQRGKDGGPKPYLSFKLDPKQVPQLPEPLPMFEIFVYAPRFEGVHLRGGKVARGGLRWSDRLEDFRTEVLGLMKAQMVKNAVIVPVGSKGGFVLKTPPPPGEREALLREGIACYQDYLRGLLDLTDNLVAGKVVAPAEVVRHDDDDPYLVVAADKGTATFSDYANAIAKEYRFWLGDAFASGGSAGYDHKKMGITARGAWEATKRHFRELGVDCQEQDFTAVGIGDMSGDVFGNGMLLSRHIRLIAAFDHRHIFIDPNPDAQTSFNERSRLFDLPRSSWADYEAKLISEGGGVWPRSAKSIALSRQARAALGLEAAALTPTELIRGILRAPVDLLYNGGIGTYVKAAAETNAAAGDRANDAIRINGEELRCRVAVEGGNLGFTQLGRIEFALRGGKINTDAIDNSGGVDCSDHEVNIKILLDSVVEDGELTQKQRNKLLSDMTDDVAALVLRDNYFQNQVLSVTRSRGTDVLDEQARYLRYLGNAGRLNRKLEFLPFDEAIAERKAAKAGLTQPELAVLLAYSKMELFDAVLASDVPEDPFISTTLGRYFPRILRERYPEHVLRHPLRREIIATHLVNSMINRVGSTFVFRLQEETGAAPPDIVRAYLATREVFALVPLWQGNEALDNEVADATQTLIVAETVRLIMRGTFWFLRHRQYLGGLAQTIERFSSGVVTLAANVESLLAAPERAALEQAIARLQELGVPEDLARRSAMQEPLFSALDIIEVGTETQRPVVLVAATYFLLVGRLDLYWLSRQITALPSDTQWQGLARVALRDDLAILVRNLTAVVLRLSPSVDEAEQAVALWEGQRQFQLGRCRQLLSDLKPAGQLDMAMLSVALRELRGLV
jgi:glutamate dehydrogenase